MTEPAIDPEEFVALVEKERDGLAGLNKAITETTKAKGFPSREACLRALLDFKDALEGASHRQILPKGLTPVVSGVIESLAPSVAELMGADIAPVEWPAVSAGQAGPLREQALILGILHWLAAELAGRGRSAEAELEYLRVIEPAWEAEGAKEVLAWSYLRLAELQAEAGSAQAEASYQQAVAVAEDSDLAYIRAIAQAKLGCWLQERRRTAEAKAILQKAKSELLALADDESFSKQLIPYKSTVLYTLGLVAYLLGETEPHQAANTSWTWIIEGLPKEDVTQNTFLAAAYNGRGNLKLKWKQEAEAENDLQAAVGVDKQDPFALSSLGSLFRARKEYGRAKSYYEQALAAKPAHAEAHLGLAMVAFDQGDYKTASDRCQDAIAIRPYYAEAHAALARIEAADKAPQQSWWQWWGQVWWRQWLAAGLGLAILAAVILPLMAPRWGWVSTTERIVETTVETEQAQVVSPTVSSPKTTTKATETTRNPSVPAENLLLAGVLLSVYLFPALSRFKAGAEGIELDLTAVATGTAAP